MTNKITTVDLHQIAAKHTKEVLHPTRYVTDSVAAMKEVIALCTPPASAQDDAKDERQAFEAWAKKKKMPLARIGQQYDDFWVDHAWNGWQARASVAAPAAGDALDAARYRWLRTSLFQQWFAVGEAEIGMRVYGACPHASEIDAAIDAALAAQVPQQGEA